MKAFCRPDYSSVEMVWMRALLGLVALFAFSGNVSETAQPAPVGLARMMDVTWVANESLHPQILVVSAIGFAIFAWGKRFSWIGAIPGLVALSALGALRNSQGKPGAIHHLQIVALVLLVMVVVYAFCSLKKRPLSEYHRAATWAGVQTVAATYLVTGLTKIIASGGQWVNDSKYFPLQLEKTRMSEYFSTLETASGWQAGLTSWVTDLFIASPNICRAVLASGLVLELGAFLALRNRTWAAGYGLLLIVFHLTISGVMQLDFTFNILVIAVLWVNLPHWVGKRFTKSA
ncbi:hypothetical protein OAF27_02905 [Verrucomicrobiales bacterium]|nr:hypothetical protein [Verrucomicrobiales bacterium]